MVESRKPLSMYSSHIAAKYTHLNGSVLCALLSNRNSVVSNVMLGCVGLRIGGRTSGKLLSLFDRSCEWMWRLLMIDSG